MSRSWHSRPSSHWAQVLREDPDDEARWRAFDALRHVAGPEETVGPFLEALGDRYWRVRALAAHALYDLLVDGPGPPRLADVVESLARALDDDSVEVAVNAAFALEAIGPNAAAAVLPLRRIAGGDGPADLRQAARDALAAIEG